MEESRRHRPDVPASLDDPGLRTDSAHLDDVTQVYATPESVQGASERSAIPVSKPESIPPKSVESPIAAPPKTPEGEPPVGFGAGRQHTVSFFIVSRRHDGTSPPPPPVAAKEGTLEITTVPPGAAVLVNGKPGGNAMAALPITAASGSIDIEARLPGYETAKKTVNLAGGERLPVSLQLVPLLALNLLLPAEGRVAINDEPPVIVEDGQFQRNLPLGAYSVKINTGRSGAVAFSFEVKGDETADCILDEAAAALARTLAAVRSPTVSGPVVLGGGILGRGGQVTDRLAASCGAEEVHAVADGAVGVCILTLRHAGTSVDASVFQQVTTSLTAVR